MNKLAYIYILVDYNFHLNEINILVKTERNENVSVLLEGVVKMRR